MNDLNIIQMNTNRQRQQQHAHKSKHTNLDVSRASYHHTTSHKFGIERTAVVGGPEKTQYET